MKILYGVQGTGNGHITRARAMAKCFHEQGVSVDFMFSGREPSQYFDMDIFGPYRTFKGLSFVTENGKVQVFKSARKLNLLSFIKDVRALNVDSYGLIINDFEPVSAWAGKLSGKKVINISHQAAFYDPLVPMLSVASLHRRFISLFAPSDLALGVHWLPFGGRILPPFVEVNCDNKQSHSFNLVYLPFENLDEIISLLTLFSDEDFIVYHPDMTEKKHIENCHINPLNRVNFIHDLQNCNGVICNAGFELSSEALTLGKKLLVKPLQGQFEQLSNAKVLVDMQRATIMHSLNEFTLDNWLTEQGVEKVNFPSDPAPLINWLLAGNYQEPEQLCEQLWLRV